MIRFLLSADVQLVASTSGDSPELKARREARFTALKRLVALACEEQVFDYSHWDALLEELQLSPLANAE